MPLAIDHWHHALHLAGPHREPQAVRERIEAVSRASASMLAEALAPWRAAHPGERVRVRRLALRFSWDVRCEPRAAAQALAEQIARCLVDTVEAGGPDVVRFASELDRIEAYAHALADGDAHQRWYFDDLDGLAVLPPGAALRTLVEGDPQLAWPLLGRLAARPAVLGLLGEGDALRWFDVLLAQAGAAAPAAMPAIERLLPRAAVPSARTLIALLARAHAQGAAPSPRLCARALALVLAAGLPRRRVRPDPASFAALGLLHGPLAERLRAIEPPGEGAWQAVQAAARAMAEPTQAEAQAAPVFDAPCEQAGLSMLLPELESLLDALPFIACGPATARRAYALAVLALVGGHPRGVWGDAAWRALLDVPAELRWADLPRGPVSPRAAARYLWQRVSRRVPGMLDSSLPYLRRNLLAAGGHARSDDGEHWRLQVPRAPLHVLLAMTSLSQRELRWSGPPARLLSIEYV